MIYALELFRDYTKNGTLNEKPKTRENFVSIKEYIKLAYERKEILPIKYPFTKQNLQTDKNWRSAIARFFMDFGNRKLDTIPLKDFSEDYADYFLDYMGSPLEALTALVCNIIRFDKEYNVINEDWMRYRASQFVRTVNDENYTVVPAFKIWETSLWC